MKKVMFVALIVMLLMVMVVPVFAGGKADSCPEAGPGAAHQSIAACLDGETVSSVSPCHQLEFGPGQGKGPARCAP